MLNAVLRKQLTWPAAAMAVALFAAGAPLAMLRRRSTWPVAAMAIALFAAGALLALFRRRSTWPAAAMAVALFAAGALLLVNPGDAAAYQPDGLTHTHETHHPEPPCPYGHDDACETNPPAALNLNPSAGHDPQAAANAARLHHEAIASFGKLNAQVQARLAWLETNANPGINGNGGIKVDGAGNGGNFATDGSGNGSGVDADGNGNGAGSGSGVDGSGNDARLAITSELSGLPWAADGQTPAERVTLAWLSQLQDLNPSLVTSLTTMPFLQDHTPGDLQAIQTLALISEGTASIAANPQYATALANYETFIDDGGIDNTEAKLIAVTSMPYFRGQHNLVGLIAAYGAIEERSVTGAHANPVTFSIVRLVNNRQNSPLMQTAVTATQHAETLMGQAIPVDFVGILVASSGDFAGANNGLHMQLDARTEGVFSERYTQHLMAHEIGHYWWGTGPGRLHEDWVSEGMAEYIGAYSVKTQFNDASLNTNNYPCAYYRTVEHIRADDPHYSAGEGRYCYYALGERLFINLDRTMGNAAFTTSIRDLYRRLATFETDQIDQGSSLMSAFCPTCVTNRNATSAAGHTLARYYGEKFFTDNNRASGVVAGLGTVAGISLVDHGSDNVQYRVGQVSASSPDQRRWVQLLFNNVSSAPSTVMIAVVQYHEDRHPYYSQWQERRVYIGDGRAWFNAYLGNPYRRATGHHWVYIYDTNRQKIAEFEYQVVP